MTRYRDHVKPARTIRRPRQRELFAQRGGKRPGAGRPKRGLRASERHLRRPRLLAREPVHVIVRAVPGLPSLRTRAMYLAIRDATIVVTTHEDFRIVHLSIQRTHVHLIVEAQHRMALARGMQAFQISAAKHVNRAAGTAHRRRRGRVFADRYHAVILKSPRQVRNTIAYVLNNWRHHGEDRHGIAQAWVVDPFSSATQFFGWKERAHEVTAIRVRWTYKAPVVRLPRTWLLSTGWRRHKLVDFHEVPGGTHVE